MKIVLDTDIIIYFLKGNEKISKKLLSFPPNDIYTTIFNITEMLYGAYNSKKIEYNLKLIKDFAKNINILHFDEEASEIFAKNKAQLKQEGKLIADFDLLIASIAIVNNCILITNNIRHFKRIKTLQVENWI